MKNIFKPFSTLLIVFVCFLMVAASCKKKPEPAKVIETGTMTDIENNVYKTVKIGNQWWMAENLKVKSYRNGTPIVSITSTDPDSVWANMTKGAYCKFQNDNNNAITYGLLYNWYVISDTNIIAPAGWHIPSDDEWKELEKYLGMSQASADNVNWRGNNEADKLKVASPQGWTTYGNVWSTNESGFSALSGSCRLFNGIWGDPGTFSTGFWWSSSLRAANNQPWYRGLDYKKSNVFRYYGPKSYGMSIRCVKD